MPSSAEAVAAVADCRPLAGFEKQRCYEERLLARLHEAGVAPALALLEEVAASDVDVERDGHVYTHAIGIEAYDAGGPVAEVFGQCTTLFQSGCYHGVIQAHFIAEGATDEGLIRELCAPYESDAQRWLLFQCLHGLGHGLTMFYDHHLPRALADCDLLANDWNRESCYGGAFMENVVNATNPHHPAAELTPGSTASNGAAVGDDRGHDAHAGGHPHGGAPGGSGDAGGRPGDAAATGDPAAGLEPFEPLRPDDPHYPCSTLDDRYLRACYMMQTSVMLWQNGGDVGAAAESCGEAPERWRPTCFQSLGRDVSSRTLQEPRASLRECRKAPEAYREWCYVGLVKNFVDLTATTEDGFSFCERVEPWAKPRCYEAMGEEIGILHATEAERRAACAVSESFELEQSCLRGARVRVN